MAKQKKKRTKRYQGIEAKQQQPATIRITAVKRSRTKQWWLDNKKIIRAGAIALCILFFVLIIVKYIFDLVASPL